MSVRIIYLFALLLISWSGALAQIPDGFKVEKIGRQVSEYSLDSIKLSSPLDYYLSRAWVRLSGKGRYWNDISTSKFYDENASDNVVDDHLRSYVLNEYIDYIVTYRDSVAVIVTHSDGEDFVLLNNCWVENGRWVNGGQGLADDYAAADAQVFEQLPNTLYNLPRIDVIKNVPDDVSPFVESLSSVTTSPEDFLLEMLASHQLVINGEIHRRKVSWNMLQRLISRPEFPEVAARVFMELPSHHQPLMDQFFSADTLNADIIVKIFQDEQLNGWWDRGEYDFLCRLWEVNRCLPHDRKIRVVLADYQIPYSSVVTPEEGNEAEDRNTHMADVIERTIADSSDKRNSLFLVGCAHAYKSQQAGFASSAHGKEAEMTAGAQLAERLGSENVFTVFQHTVSGDNSGRNRSAIRGGAFDKAFESNGNRPVGFKLRGTPFGNEPFDAIYEIKYNTATGSYADNYDGYLFLGPLATEPQATPLTEIFTDEFVAEMQRRARVLGLEDYRWIWFGYPASELTKEKVIEALLKD